MAPGQQPQLDPSRDGRLVLILAPYFGSTVPATPQLVSLFIPPAYKKTVAPSFLNDCRTYVMNFNVAGLQSSPWGDIRLIGTVPLKLGLLPGSVWAFSDADQQNPRVLSAPWRMNTPPNIVHGQHRLAMRFDGSAGDIDAGELALPPPQ